MRPYALDPDELLRQVGFDLWETMALVYHGVEATSDSTGYEFSPPKGESLVFFGGHPSEDELPDFHRRFPQWLITVGLRRYIEVYSTFLERAGLLCLALDLAPLPAGETGQQVANEDLFPQYFDTLSLNRKLSFVERAVGPIGVDGGVIMEFSFGPPDMRQDVLSLNRARNCLEHRRGRVSEPDLWKVTSVNVVFQDHRVIRPDSYAASSSFFVSPPGPSMGVQPALTADRDSALM